MLSSLGPIKCLPFSRESVLKFGALFLIQLSHASDKGFITNFLWSQDGNSWSTLPYKVVLHVILVPLRNRYLITVFYVSLFYWLYCKVLSLFRPSVVTLHCIYVFPLPPYSCCSCCLGDSFVVAVVDSRIQSFKNSDSKHGKRDYKESKNVE